jgi:glycosyltransferase involved in cell wall biosynthesis
VSSRVAILVPVLGRPGRVATLLQSIAAATPEPHRVLFIADPDDHETLEAIAATSAAVIAPGGSYAQKINAGIAHTDEPLLFLGADDLTFHPGWLPAAAAHLTATIGVVGTNDLANPRVIAGEHATHSLVTRAYVAQGTIDGPGLLHEGYRHNFVDDELTATAKSRRAWAFAADSHVEHHHPDWGTADRDATYARGRATWRIDRRLWARRRRLIPAAPPAIDVTIAISTFGEESWIALAHERAIPSALAQGVRVVHEHAATLCEARNATLAAVATDYVVFLDADDELEPGYLHHIAAGHGDIRVPAVAYTTGSRRRPPRMPRVAGHHHDCTPDCLHQGNWIVVGAAVRTDLARNVGGWRDFDVYEDWDFWLRCYLAGADIQTCPAAVYRAHVRPTSRNRAPAMDIKNRVHHEILAANGLAAA